MNTVNSGTVKDLKIGQSILTNVRKINKDRKDPSKGFNFQIEVREVMAETSLLAILNPTDDRIIKPKAQPAWAMVEPDTFKELFNIPQETMDKLNALPVSTGVKELRENEHFISVNILNPTVLGNPLHVQIVETTEGREGQNPKVNPATGVVMTHKGKPIYRNATIVNYKPVRSITRLETDVVTTTVEEPVAEVSNTIAPNPIVAAAAR